jgi:hypothetical protein
VTDDHPAPIVRGELPAPLTIVIPEHLARDKVVAYLVDAITTVRTYTANQAAGFQRLAMEHAASGDHLKQALCRGLTLGYDAATLMIEQEIIKIFDLFGQWEAQDSTEEPTP